MLINWDTGYFWFMAKYEAQEPSCTNQITRLVLNMIKHNICYFHLPSLYYNSKPLFKPHPRVIMKEHFKGAVEHATEQQSEESLESLYGIIDKFIK